MLENPNSKVFDFIVLKSSLNPDSFNVADNSFKVGVSYPEEKFANKSILSNPYNILNDGFNEFIFIFFSLATLK